MNRTKTSDTLTDRQLAMLGAEIITIWVAPDGYVHAKDIRGVERVARTPRRALEKLFIATP
jgi:hypothetical protein